MIILGIHDGHGSSACISVNGTIRVLVAEERFTRKKNDSGYPFNAINWCLDELNMTASDLDKVAVATTDTTAFSMATKALCDFQNEDWLAIEHRYWKPKLFDNVDNYSVFDELWLKSKKVINEHYYSFDEIKDGKQAISDTAVMKKIREEGIVRHLQLEKEKIQFYDHHKCHAYYALYGSPHHEENTLVYTLDGGGDNCTSTLSYFEQGKLKEIARSNQVDVARIYRTITTMLGMKQGEHEFKVMGLSPYASQREVNKSKAVFEKMFAVQDDLISYDPSYEKKDIYFTLKDKFEGHRFDGIASAVQGMTEETVCAWVSETTKKYECNNIVFSGGVAMNVKLNSKLAKLPTVSSIYVCPSPGDDTLCIGACYQAIEEAGSRSYPITSPYLGPKYRNEQAIAAIGEMLDETRYTITHAVTEQKIAETLAQGKVVARCAGKMEFGARALGNRSILANPKNTDIVAKINHQIKNRDFWMPFAPVILAEYFDDYFIKEQPLENYYYMMIGAETTALAQENISAGLHQADKTARPQVITEDNNKQYYNIIDEFRKITGIPVLLNTSFNLHGEPIVCTFEDAISTFIRSDIDVLLLNNIFIERT